VTKSEWFSLDAAELRRRAEAEMQRQHPATSDAWDAETARLVHELQVHQIELEMQNQALRAAHDKVDALRVQFQDLFDFAPAGYLTLDALGSIVQVNATAARLLDTPPTALLRRRLGILIHPEDRVAFNTFVDRAQGFEPQAHCEVRVPLADGTARVVRLDGVCSRDGSPMRVMLTDVTARALATEAHDLQSAALNAAADAMMIVNRAGAIEWVNAAFTALTGFSAAEARGRPVHGDATTRWRNDVWRGEVQQQRKDGTRYLEERTITPVRNAQGEIAHFVASARDVTEERLLEDQRRQALQMEAVGRLAGGIAHDFNNLLTVVNGRTELALRSMPTDDPHFDDLQEIGLAGARAAALTRQLLAISRRQVMHAHVFDLGALVNGLETVVRRLVGDEVAVTVEVPAEPAYVSADPSQIEEAIANCSVNARDAMPAGGSLRVTVSVDEATPTDVARGVVQTAGPHVALAITDSGQGMADEVRVHALEPFFTTKDVGKGRGLGLSTVYGIVRQSGGGVELQSAPGAGSTITLRLPQAVRGAEATTDAAVMVSAPAVETVLIVEDEPSVRILAERVLRMAGYTVLSAPNGAAALLVLAQQPTPVDLVVTDIVMPGMNGWDLGREVQRLWPQTHVLYTSGYNADARPTGGVDESALHFLPKPYSVAQLTREVRSALG
jgi:PAS domain S-box-containing protein